MNDQTEKRGTSFPQQAAQACLFAPLIALVMGIFNGGLPDNQSTARLVIGITCMGLVAAGTILGIVALAGIRKHGAKGILVRSIIGLTINGLLITAIVSTLTALPKLRERFNKPQYSFKVPKTYKEDPEGKTNNRVLESYITGDPYDDIPDILCSIEDLGGTIENQDIDHMVKGRSGITVQKMKWKRYEINVVRVEESIQGIQVMTFNAQIPLIPRAIQVKLSGLKQIESELEKELKSILLRIDGRSNW